ncbi:MAG: hypothetical protein J5982_02410 [Bacilli bacterium]|nr:hypothetical protein [Bacilli bacterium]
MEKNIYQNRINLYINELDKVDLANPLVVLEWFYKVSDASIMFQISEVSDLIYTKLINNGYREVLSSEEEAKTYYSLINARMINLDDLARNIIALILKSIKEHKSIDLTVQSFIKIFNEKFNAEDIFSLMMERLKNNIGTRIVATIVVNNEFILKVGTLNQVNDYVSITIDEEIIPFIGKNIAISKLNSINGNSLYNNSRVIPSMDLSNATNITRLNEEIFKDNYRQAVAKVI